MLGSKGKMFKLKICPKCNNYTLEPECKRCKIPTKQAGYKFITPYYPKAD